MPDRKVDQVLWAATFNQVVGNNAAAYGVPADLMSDFSTLNTALQTAWTIAQTPAKRTKVTVDQADNALKAMKTAARSLVSLIQGTPTVTSDMKVAAGVTVRKTTPSKKPAPTTAPKLSVVAQNGRTLTIELANADSTKRARPADVQNALVFTHTGTSAPVDENSWTFYATTTSRTLDVTFPPSTTGDTVFITAMWVNAKSETGPAATPVSVNLPAGGFLPQAAEKKTPMRKAA